MSRTIEVIDIRSRSNSPVSDIEITSCRRRDPIDKAREREKVRAAAAASTAIDLDDDEDVQVTKGVSSFEYNSQLPDFQIHCREHIFEVHSTVLITQSKFFRAACCGYFIEARTRRVDFSEDETGVVRRMLDFLYTGSYGNDNPLKGKTTAQLLRQPPSDPPNPLESQMMHIAVYHVADKYEIEALRRYSCAQFQTIPVYFWRDEWAEILLSVLESTPDTKIERRFNLRLIALDMCLDEIRTSRHDFKLDTKISLFAEYPYVMRKIKEEIERRKRRERMFDEDGMEELLQTKDLDVPIFWPFGKSPTWI